MGRQTSPSEHHLRKGSNRAARALCRTKYINTHFIGVISYAGRNLTSTLFDLSPLLWGWGLPGSPRSLYPPPLGLGVALTASVSLNPPPLLGAGGCLGGLAGCGGGGARRGFHFLQAGDGPVLRPRGCTARVPLIGVFLEAQPNPTG